jgi:serine phosphatase RsbU (regulator of sigma subunit)/putative methionine-R-sulfoxide reductase with GAF domain
LTQPTADRLALLYRVSQVFNSSLDLDAVLARVMDEVIAATRAERGFLMLYDADGELAFRAARGLDRQTIDAPEFQISRGLVERVARESVPQLASDAQSDSWLGKRASVTDLRLRSILCVPLQSKTSTIGVIYVDNRLQAGIFTQDDLELLSALAHQAAIAIDNARLFSDAQSKLSSLRLLHDISADLTSTLDLNRVLIACLQRVQNLLGVATASILTVEGDELVFQVAIGDKSDQVKPFRVPMGHGIAGWVAQNAQATFSNDVARDPRFYHRVDDGTGFITRALMAAPLVVNERVTGVVEVSNKPGGFSESDVDLLSTIAGGAAIAIENARLYQIAVEKGRIERELQVAYEVQSSLLPAETPKIDGWEFAALWHPARVVGGDYYDFVPIRLTRDSKAPAGVGIIIGDVTDKGMPAALFMALTRSTVRASLIPGRSPVECITRANALIAADSPNGMFVSLFYAQIDPVSGEMTYVNAGHNPPLHYRAAQGDLVELTRTGIVLGIEREFQFEQRMATLSRGDFVVLYTDGVSEAADAQSNEFGVERMTQIILDHRGRPAGDIITAVKSELDSFAKGVPQFDDITMVAFKRL